MLRLILPIVIVLVGVAGGGAAGYFLAPPPPEPMACSCEEVMEAKVEEEAHDGEHDPEKTYEYVEFSSQFVVPVIDQEQLDGMVVVSLSLELEPGNTEAFYSREPRLRDEFFRRLYAYSTIGGFTKSYVDGSDLKLIRKDLTELARSLMGPVVNAVLIVDLIRQDI